MSDILAEEDKEPVPKRQKLSCTRAEEISVEETVTDASCHASVDVDESGLVRKFLKEADVGITEFVCRQPGFFAILKQRYSDFLVREIAADGQLVCLQAPIAPERVASGDEEEKKAELEELFSADNIEQLRNLVTHKSNEDKIQQYIDIEADSEKEKRTAMHQMLKTYFPSLSSRTVELGKEKEGEDDRTRDKGKRIIRVWCNNGARDNRNPPWPGGKKKKYCRFVLYKENRDTVAVIGYIARELGVKPQVFQSAGLKDRRAITTQHYTAFKVTAERLLALNGSLKNVKISDPVYVSEPLKLGQLVGNQFTIVLRSVSCDDHVINEKMTSLRDEGFVNYFGMQRFGTSTIPTYCVGRCILHSDWRGAVDAILAPRPGENEEMTLARQYYMTTRNAKGTLEKLPRGRPLEKAVLQGLVKRKGLNDYLGALKCIPYSSRLMYVHSYQSLVWNRIVTYRIKELGFKPILGDLVLGNGNEPQVITEETLSQYTIHDIMLPLPGYDVILPHNKVKEKYEAVLAEDKLTFQHLKHKVKDFMLHGSYRHLIVKPKDLEWDIMLYDDVTIPLTLNDSDILEDKPIPESIPGGQSKAIRMSFSLPTACYATMAVRELVKMETSSHYQAQLNPQNNDSKSTTDQTS